MTTALDMIPAIGARVIVRFESLQIEAKVVNVKNSWGKPRLLIQPVAGTGEQWVELERITVPQPTVPGVNGRERAEKVAPSIERYADREGLHRPALFGR